MLSSQRFLYSQYNFTIVLTAKDDIKNVVLEGNIEKDHFVFSDVIMIYITQKHTPHQQSTLNIIYREPPYNNPV